MNNDHSDRLTNFTSKQELSRFKYADHSLIDWNFSCVDIIKTTED